MSKICRHFQMGSWNAEEREEVDVDEDVPCGAK
jgi:hypothetical protein